MKQAIIFDEGLDNFINQKEVNENILFLWAEENGLPLPKPLKTGQYCFDKLVQKNWDKFHTWVDKAIKSGKIDGDDTSLQNPFQKEEKKKKNKKLKECKELEIKSGVTQEEKNLLLKIEKALGRNLKSKDFRAYQNVCELEVPNIDLNDYTYIFERQRQNIKWSPFMKFLIENNLQENAITFFTR